MQIAFIVCVIFQKKITLNQQYSKGMVISRQAGYTIALTRMVVGWHFLFEGMVKVLNPAWTARAYLLDSGGWFRNFFVWIAGHETILHLTDLLNAWGLTIIGLLLILGIFGKWAAGGGMFLLALYYLSHPPLPGIEYLFPSDGSYFIVNKTLIEWLLMLVIYQMPMENLLGVRRLFVRKVEKA